MKKVVAGADQWRGRCASWRPIGVLLTGLALVPLSACAGVGAPFGWGEPASPLEGVEIELESDQDAYEPYEPIRLTLEVRNPGVDTISLRFPTSQRYDFTIVDSAGTVRWRWSDNRAFAPAEGESILPPGGSVSWSGTFEGLLPPGEYVAEGVLPTGEGRLRSSLPLLVQGTRAGGVGPRRR